MAVTKQVYSASPVWTAATLASRFRDAFIDAGLMTDWYDSFASGGIENRILEVVYDSTATYGKCYYWFMFSPTFAGFAIATGWSIAANAPTGTQYLDFPSTSTSVTTNHHSLTTGRDGNISATGAALITGTEISITRYTSAINTDYSWFVLRNGAVPYPFMIAPANVSRAAWLDLGKTVFHHYVKPLVEVRSDAGDNSTCSIRFESKYRLRRSFVGGQSLRADTNIVFYRNAVIPLAAYVSFANSNSGSNVNAIDFTTNSGFNASVSAVIVPAGRTNTNPAYTTNYAPIFFGPSYSPYVNERLPDDFAIYFPFTATQFAFGSRIVVTAGTEEWEVMDFRNNTSADAPNPLFLARVV